MKKLCDLFKRNSISIVCLIVLSFTGFGYAETIGDFDGDGKTDPAIWRRTGEPNGQAYFYVLSSLRQGYYAIPWGNYGTDTAPMFYLQAR